MLISIFLFAVVSSLPGVFSFYTPVERLMFFDNLFEKTIHNGTITHKSMIFEGNLYFWDTSNHTKHYKYCEHPISDSRFSDIHLNGSRVSLIFLQCVDSFECCELKCCEKASLSTILVRWTLLAITFVAIFVSCFECLRFSTVKILSRIKRDDECNLMISTVDGGYLNPQLDNPVEKSMETAAEKRRLLQIRKYESLHEAVEKRNILSESAVPLCSPIEEEPLPSLPSPNWHLRQMTRV
ncbi:hypothetical protein PENTCL1PPCAC_17045 [Pristionchus entomophagus]|uniref:CX domain-containing protein n=1 Tax=Pristionchus entomophagus TaxID=358040 RepID=A0AAV5TKG7_9BILA|nr:hypothetical protein PENTCL1PPCAC_17045 [Pristionchus entomophagus]